MTNFKLLSWDTFFGDKPIPLKKEYAFKYEPQDVSEVNFYFADYKKSEVNETLKKLEYLEGELGSNVETLLKALQTVEPILPTPFIG